jgi:transcriptional regulator with XRE-family HTH domain
MDVGEKLRVWREKVGLSQDEAARRVGTSQRTWGAWEANGTTPEIDFAEAIEKMTNGGISMRDWARGRRRRRKAARAAESSSALPEVEDADLHGRSVG